MDFEQILKSGLGLGVSSSLARVPFYFGSVFSTNMQIDDLTKDGKSVLPLTPSSKGMIRMLINPGTVTFDQPKKITRRDTLEGVTHIHWTDTDGFNNDLLTLKFAGETGSLDPRDSSSARRHLAWAKLHDLTAEKVLDLSTGRKNKAFCFFQSVTVPFQVMFVGHFPAVMAFGEAKDAPFNKKYSFDFVVEQMTPSLNRIQEHISTKLLSVGTLQRLGGLS